MTDFYSMIARKKYGLSEEWKAYIFEAVGEPPNFIATKITGAVAPLKTRGANKGDRNWSKMDKSTKKTVYIKPEEYSQFISEWEAETGLCSKCRGTGQEVHGSHIELGTYYRQCKKCCGTGKPGGEA